MEAGGLGGKGDYKTQNRVTFNWEVNLDDHQNHGTFEA
jgi:hypothetical protein